MNNKGTLAPNSNKEMTVHTITMRRREHSSLHLNGIQTAMRRSAVSKIIVHEDICGDRANRKDTVKVMQTNSSKNDARHVGGITKV